MSIFLKTFNYRLKPTPKQIQQMNQFVGNNRFLWNKFLELNNKKYEEEKRFIFYSELCRKTTELKKELEFLKLSPSQALQQELKKLEQAIKDGYKKNKGFPKFKKRGCCNESFVMPQGVSVNNKFITLPKIKKIAYYNSQKIDGKIKQAVVKKDVDKWYISIVCEIEVEDKPVDINMDNVAGIDLGIKELASFSDGSVTPNPRHFKKYEKKISRENKRLSRKKRGSNNRTKQRKRLAKRHQKLRNTRKDFIHKFTSSTIAKYDGVIMETLNVEGMKRFGKLGKHISDVSFAEIIRQLKYKAEWNQKLFYQIGRFQPSSKTCSECGWKFEDQKLSDRTFNCPDCGLVIDRDLNASINIKHMGFEEMGYESNTVGHTGIHACGEEMSLDASPKQEAPRALCA